MGGQQKQYSAEFKQEALILLETSGKSALQIAHEFGAAAYATKAVRAAFPKSKGERAGGIECHWQSEQLPDAV